MSIQSTGMMASAIAQVPPTSLEQECPECHSTIPVYRGYVTWCEQCNWNMQPTPPEKPSSRIGKFYDRISKKMSKGLFAGVMAQPRLKPTLTRSIVLAYLIATIVHLMTLGLAVASIVLLITQWPHILIMVFALMCLGIAWIIRPRFNPMPKEVLTRDEAPGLYAIVDRVAEVLGAPPIHGIVIDKTFNASFAHYGFAQKRIITIGLPLFAVLTSEEKISLIAHELAHGVNGDPQRRFFIYSAINSLIHWANIVHPQQIWAPGGGLIGLVASFGMVALNLVLLGLSNLLAFTAYGLLHLIYRDSQRAEYLADHLSATIAGTSHTLSALEKHYSQPHLQVVTHRFVLGRQTGDLFVTLQQAHEEIPEHERERLRRVNVIEDARLDSSHPPTAYRVEYLKAVPTAEPKFSLSPQEEEQLNEALAHHQPKIQQQIIETFRGGQYF